MHDQNEALAQIDQEINERKLGLSQHISSMRSALELRGIEVSTDRPMELTQGQVGELKRWHQETTDGQKIMPTLEIAASKVYLVSKLWPQENGRNYLFGKGIGQEISLQGEVLGRTRRPGNVECRPHEDFEFYNVTGGYPPYPKDVVTIFGNQEYYPPQKTKTINGLPPDYLSETAEAVDFGGERLYVPQLELQFIEKYGKDSRKRKFGDRECGEGEVLALAYVLDHDLILKYYDQYVVKPAVDFIEQSANEYQDEYTERIRHAYNMEIHYGASHEKAVAKLNRLTQIRLEHGDKPSSTPLFGLELSPDQIDGDGNLIDVELADKALANIENDKQKSLAEVEAKKLKLIEFLAGID